MKTEEAVDYMSKVPYTIVIWSAIYVIVHEVIHNAFDYWHVMINNVSKKLYISCG